MNEQDYGAKQRGPDRSGVGPGVETGPPSVVSRLRLGQGASLLRVANCDWPGSAESSPGNGQGHSVAGIRGTAIEG